MRWLPCSAAPLHEQRLPLADSSAECLIEALLTEQPAVSVAKLDAALRLDPALAIWCICHLPAQRDRSGIETIGSLAARFAAGLPDCLVAIDWQREAEPGPLAKECSRLASESALIAARAAEVAAAGNSVAPDGAYLFGQLHNLAGWLAIGESDQVADTVTLPASRIADEIRALLEPQNASDCVGRAAADCVERALTAEDPPADEAVLAAREAARWWQERVQLAEQLPALVEKISRLNQLENRFGAALEDEKLQAMYKLAAGAGHEINNPLGSIAGRAQLLLRDEADPERRRTLAKINSQAFRAHEMISDMMLFARPPAPHCQRLDPGELIDDLVLEMQEIAEQSQSEIVRGKIESPGNVEADPTQMTVALRAMCQNALEAIGEGGRIVLSARQVTDDMGTTNHVEISVSDNGPGLSAEQRRHLFDPFYSGREAGRGLGFGLSKCWRIVRNHGGTIDVVSTLGHGATFRILLPAA